jgi:hypothetical protein
MLTAPESQLFLTNSRFFEAAASLSALERDHLSNAYPPQWRLCMREARR